MQDLVNDHYFGVSNAPSFAEIRSANENDTATWLCKRRRGVAPTLPVGAAIRKLYEVKNIISWIARQLDEVRLQLIARCVSEVR